MRSTTQPNDLLRDGVAFALALALGPVFIAIGYSLHLVYEAGAIFYFLWCVLVAPCLILLSSRFRFWTWQLAVGSLTLSGIGDNLRLGAIDRREILSVTFVFWAAGSMLSSPIPIYLLLRSVPPPRRYTLGFFVVVAGVALWLAIKHVTG